jgi:hypothetical protein
MAITTVTINPGAGGANVAVDQQPSGAAMPISELAVSPDGIQASVPVAGNNPLPVGDAIGQAALADIRANIQTIADQVLLGILQVAAKIAGAPAGIPDVNNVVSMQGVPGGTAVTVAGSAKVQGLEVVGSAPAFNPLFAAYIDPNSLVRLPTFNAVAGGGFGGPTTYSNVVTDLEGFRDDFNGASLVQTLAGTCTFTNGSTAVTGAGTSFTSQLATADDYVKLSTDPDSAWAKLSVQPFYANPTGGSNAALTLASAYTGAGGVGTGQFTSWADTIGIGGSIAVASSQFQLSTGTTSGSQTFVVHGTHFIAPCNVTVYAWASQAIANQEFVVGLVDNVAAPGTQTAIVFNGTDATQIRLRTSSANGSAETNVGTLPNGLLWTTAGAVRYRLVASEDAVVLFANDIPVVRNKLHLPAFYQPQPLTIAASNTGAVGSSSTLFVDAIGITSHDKVEVEMATTPQPAPSQLSGYDALGNLQQPLVTAPGVAATTSSSALVVAVSPATPVTASGVTAAGLQAPLPLREGAQVLSVTEYAIHNKLDAIVQQLEAIKWILMTAYGHSAPISPSAPSFVQ